jgi:hypothetical protein
VTTSASLRPSPTSGSRNSYIGQYLAVSRMAASARRTSGM